MLNKTEFEGWWDQVCMRQGWSHKISKWKWIALQSIIPILIILPIALIVTYFLDGFSLREFFSVIFIMMPLVAIFQSGGWSRDQKRSKEI